MKFLSGKFSVLAFAVAGALMLASTAGAATVNITENDGTVRTINSPPAFSITNTNIAGEFGTYVTSTPAGGTLIVFSPTSAFAASASNTVSGQSQQTDGKLVFTLTFDNPTLLTAIINEGGSYLTSGTGFVSVNIGGTITETDTLAGPQLIANTSTATVLNGDNTWSAQVNMGSFNQAYSSYKFSLDNVLDAEAPGSTPGTASISKTNFSIYIPPPGGSSNPTPLPLAAFGGMGLGAAALMLRKRLFRA